ncbi:MAG: hypothetical protein J6L62_03795 [Clostridia bacterium]|nr:hypothetical protein [Clostridia bacterium]
MNTSTKNNSLFLKIPVLSAFAAILIAVPLRIFQYLKLIDPSTGFYNEKDFSVIILYAILVIVMILSIVLPYLKHKTIQPVSVEKSSKVFLAVSLLMALGTAIDAVGLITDFVDLISDVPQYIDRKSLTEYISAQGGTLILIQGVFAIISAFYFVISGLSALNEKMKAKFKILALSPVVWCVFRLLLRFKRTIAFINVSDLLLELFAIVFAMVFFLAIAQIRAKIDADSIFWKIFAYGIPTAVLAVVCFLPRFILLITGNSEMINALHPIYASDLTLAIYAGYICISSLKSEPKES